MSDFSLPTNIASLFIEWLGVLYFYRPLEIRSEGRARYFGWVWLLFLIPLYIPIIPELNYSTVFSLDNLFNQLLRTLINLIAIYGYLRCTREKGRSVCLYLSALYVLIYICLLYTSPMMRSLLSSQSRMPLTLMYLGSAISFMQEIRQGRCMRTFM